MLRTLRVSNYRSLGEEVVIDFERLCVFVGPNGSGKSNIVDVLRFVSDAARIGLPGAISLRHGIGAVRRWSAGHPFNVRVALELSLTGGPAHYSFELTGSRTEEYEVKSERAMVTRDGAAVGYRIEKGTWLEGPPGLQPLLDQQNLALQLVGGDTRFQDLVRTLQSISIYSIFPDTLRAPQKYNPTKPMTQHGDNWVSILKDQPPETWHPDLVAALHRLTGDVKSIRTKQVASYLVAEFEHLSPGTPKAKKWFDAAQESDGTLRVAGIITALLQEPAVPIIGIEEPELTVHPGAAELIFDHLAQASHRSQVLVTTHSPELLDRIQPEDVRVVTKADGATSVSAMAERDRKVVRERLMTLGELFRREQLSLPLGGLESAP